MPYVVYNKKNGDTREFGPAEKASIYMLGRSVGDHIFIKYNEGEPDRVLNNASIFIDELKQQLVDL